jgi:hypothetical protein
MEKSGNSNDRNKHKIVAEEIERFEKLVEGHRNLLLAIGNL